MDFKKNFFLIILFLPVSVFAQIQTTSDTLRMDSLFFLNGEVSAVKVVDTTYNIIRFLPEKRKRKIKVMDVAKDRVFSIKFSDGQERLIYFYDTTIGNVFTVLEAKMFMLGEREAEVHYKNKWPFIIGFTVGSFSPLIVSNAVALSPIAPAITPLHTLIPKIKVNTQKIENKNYLSYETYIMGYEKVARKKNFSKSIIGAAAGLAIGFGTWAVPDETWYKISGYDQNYIPPLSEPFSKKVERFARKNFVYAVWAAEVGCTIGISTFFQKKEKRK